MGCGSCGTSSSSGLSTCSTKCGNGCSSVGKLGVHDWLSDMIVPGENYDAIEVRFKGGRKEIYRNVHHLEIYTGDSIIVEASPGHHVGMVSMQGELVRLQMKKKKIEFNDELPVIYRLATPKDLEKFEESKNREISTLYRSREIIQDLKLEMKLSDVEFQADNTKATFYYSADERVDFRELIKLLASEFRVRVEMRQISLRQEAGRLGGVGSCGRELCCSTWLTDFKSVSTGAARYQNLSLNPGKLSGQCGRLKCCLNYELDTYVDALKGIPEVNKFIETKAGKAHLQKTDIFKKLMWFSFNEENNWFSVDVKRVQQILDLNKQGKLPFSLELDFEEAPVDDHINDDLRKLDKRLNKKSLPKSAAKKRRVKPKNTDGGIRNTRK